MNADHEHADIQNNENEQRYKLHMGDQLAVLEYKRKGNHITYISRACCILSSFGPNPIRSVNAC
ncbi:MAG: hypothetical protein NVS4B12_26280 [Ktedonobacteraceae bacterium]